MRVMLGFLSFGERVVPNRLTWPVLAIGVVIIIQDDMIALIEHVSYYHVLGVGDVVARSQRYGRLN